MTVDVRCSWIEFDTNASTCDVRCSWVEFDANASTCDVRCSWVEFDANASTCDVRCSWVQFDTQAKTVNDDGWMGGGADVFTIRQRTKEEVEQERIALGILPQPVAKVIKKIARKAIRKAADNRAPDVLKWVQQHDWWLLYDRQLRRELSRHNQTWEQAYTNLILMAIEEEMQAEADAVLMLLMEL